MEFLTILLSSLLALISPGNLVIDKVLESNLRSRLNKVEQLQVRVDNAPSYQIAQGKIERVRIAGRGLWLTPDIRLGALEVETDPINANLQRLTRGGSKSAPDLLQQPAQAGVRLVLTQADINNALKSPTVTAQLRRLGSSLAGTSGEPYEFINPRVEFLSPNRVRFQVKLQKKDGDESLALMAESGIQFTSGHRLDLIEPVATINGQPLSPRIVAGFAEGISRRFNLRNWEDAGMIIRVLQLEIDKSELEIAAFIRVDSSHLTLGASPIAMRHL